ncbi:MAG: hypothetical protein K6E45_03090 [Bacteroidaceae bacterium]|nr:hypothetical protein [Bacteroidaceae bacterium]
MKAFEYEQYRVVGLVEDKLGDNATINVIGYCDDNLHVCHMLNEAETLELFPTRGKVFAYRFNLEYKHLKGSIVCLCVQPSNKDDRERYVWDWDAEVIPYGRRIYTLKGVFSEDSQQNYNILSNNGLLDVNNDKLVYSGGRVYQIIPGNNDRVLKYWEASSLEMVTIDGNKYFVGISLPKHDGLLDVTNDEQLANWYLSKVVKKNWSSIVQAQSFRNSESFLRELLSSQKDLDAATIENRLKRLLSIDTSISLMFDSLKEIAETPWFSEVVNRSIAQEKEHLIEQLKNDNLEEILKIKKEHDLEVMRLEEEQNAKIEKLQQIIDEKKKGLEEQERSFDAKLQEKNFEIELLDETIKEKQQAITTLEGSIAKMNDRKSSIIQDFSIIHEVLSASIPQSKVAVVASSKQFALEEINYSVNPITRFQAYVKSLENILKSNEAPKCSPQALARLLAKYIVVLCPSQTIAQTLILASHKCRYITEYVSAKWASFDDLWNNGLAYIVEKCNEETDTIHFLLLQNINISYLPNFLQPLVDLQKGLIKKFPATDIPLPKNLRVLCTVSEDELIKMPSTILRYFGCIDKECQFETLSIMKMADDSNLGYLTTEELIREGQQDFEVHNMFEQYIDE